jgi:hypothetical protein
VVWDAASDTVVVSGYFDSSTDFGTGMVVPNGGDIVIMRVSDVGTTEWAVTAGNDAAGRRVERIALAPDGAIYFGGQLCGSITIGGSTASATCFGGATTPSSAS